MTEKLLQWCSMPDLFIFKIYFFILPSAPPDMHKLWRHHITDKSELYNGKILQKLMHVLVLGYHNRRDIMHTQELCTNRTDMWPFCKYDIEYCERDCSKQCGSLIMFIDKCFILYQATVPDNMQYYLFSRGEWTQIIIRINANSEEAKDIIGF